MSPSPDSPALGEARTTAMEPLYAEVCRAHDAITDFRGKLLALVPTLSGAAFALIIGTRNDFDSRLLLPVGMFGVAVALGLFCYELRGMLLCVELRNRVGSSSRRCNDPQLRPKRKCKGTSSTARSIIKLAMPASSSKRIGPSACQLRASSYTAVQFWAG